MLAALQERIQEMQNGWSQCDRMPNFLSDALALDSTFSRHTLHSMSALL